MAFLGTGSWYHPDDEFTPSERMVARRMFVDALNEFRPAALVALHREVYPAFQRCGEAAAPRDGSALMVSGRPSAIRKREPLEDLGSAFWDGGAPFFRSSLQALDPRSLVPPDFRAERVRAIREFVPRLFRWCSEWNLPPSPDRILAPDGVLYECGQASGTLTASHPELWLFETLGATFRSWSANGATDLKSAVLTVPPLGAGSSHPVLPRPAGLSGVRPWWPTLEPWKTRGGIGYFYDATAEEKRGDLSGREAERLLRRYKAQCEESLRQNGYEKTRQKRKTRRPVMDHFRWMVRFQVPASASGPCETVNSIVDDPAGPSVEPENVRREVRNVARLLPLTRRSVA